MGIEIGGNKVGGGKLGACAEKLGTSLEVRDTARGGGQGHCVPAQFNWLHELLAIRSLCISSNDRSMPCTVH